VTAITAIAIFPTVGVLTPAEVGEISAVLAGDALADLEGARW
jgi:hypothetical protein